jgi:tRNA G18 (ribose-2'-O)-methylase SpoU
MHLTFILENPTKAGNIGAVMRNCLAFGIELVVITNHQLALPGRNKECTRFQKQILQASKGASRWMKLRTFATSAEAFENLQNAEHWATCPHNASCKLSEFKTSSDHVAIWFGSEAHGLTPETRKKIGRALTIPIQTVESLNLSVSTGIVAAFLRLD